MERHEDTFDIDTIKHLNGEWETTLLRGGEDAVGNPVYVEDQELDFDGPVAVTFGEYITTIEGNIEATVSWVEREWEGESYEEDYQIEQLTVKEGVAGFECPQCGKGNKGGTFVLGHHYCPDCDIRYADDGEIIGEGRA